MCVCVCVCVCVYVCVCICIWKLRIVNAGLPRECSAVWIIKFQGHRELTSALGHCISVYVSELRRNVSNQIHIRSKVSPEKVRSEEPDVDINATTTWAVFEGLVTTAVLCGNELRPEIHRKVLLDGQAQEIQAWWNQRDKGRQIVVARASHGHALDVVVETSFQTLFDCLDASHLGCLSFWIWQALSTNTEMRRSERPHIHAQDQFGTSAE